MILVEFVGGPKCGEWLHWPYWQPDFCIQRPALDRTWVTAAEGDPDASVKLAVGRYSLRHEAVASLEGLPKYLADWQGWK